MLLNRLVLQLLEHLSFETAGFRSHRSSMDPILNLTTHIEAVFQRRLKTAMVFVALTAA